MRNGDQRGGLECSKCGQQTSRRSRWLFVSQCSEDLHGEWVKEVIFVEDMRIDERRWEEVQSEAFGGGVGRALAHG